MIFLLHKTNERDIGEIMVTIYDLLEVREDASKEEIEKAYQNLALEYKVNPILSEKENKENEMVLNKLKIAYEILMNDEKREKYDKDLAKKRAEDLLRNVSTSSEESFKSVNNDENISSNKGTEENNENKSQNKVNVNNNETIENEENVNGNEVIDEENDYDENEEVVLSKKDQDTIQKAAQKDFKKNLKKAQKIEEEYNQAYNKAYNDYLRKMGYKTKEPVTLKRIITTIVTILVIILVCFILWKIPPIHTILVNVYEENIVIKSLVDIVKIIFQSIASML